MAGRGHGCGVHVVAVAVARPRRRPADAFEAEPAATSKGLLGAADRPGNPEARIRDSCAPVGSMGSQNPKEGNEDGPESGSSMAIRILGAREWPLSRRMEVV